METASLVEDVSGDDPGAAPQLIVALFGEAPADWLSRHLLGELDTVEIGRGRSHKATRILGTVRRLVLALPDRAVSEQHVRLTRLRGRWVVEDLGAKNRCLLNGHPVTEGRLSDGDVLELGRTVLLFRDAVAPVPGPDDALASALPAALPGLRTLSGALGAVHRALAAVATTPLPVVLRGGSGTGKELIARALHAGSRRAGPFVAVNCAAIPAQLLESELFGHRRGAFSGAVADRPGHVRAADGGTLLLDEIADLPLPAQAALLRVLQEREVVPVGDSLPTKVDVRVIAASHADLGARVAAGTFRADLLARLDGLTAIIPGVAERREDLGLLVGELLGRLGPNGSTAALSTGAARALFAHDWPGNVRELEMALARAVAMSGGGTIDVAHLPEPVMTSLQALARGGGAERILSEADQSLRVRVTAALAAHRGNVSAVARELGKARWQIHRWMRDFALDPASFRDGGAT